MTTTFEDTTSSSDATVAQTNATETSTDNVLSFSASIEDVQPIITAAPSVVAHPTADQLNEYSAWSRKADDAIETNLFAGQTALSTLVAFCALVHLGLDETPDQRVMRAKDWADKKHIRTVKSKYCAANTVAALLNLDIGDNDKNVAKRNRSRIDRDASAIEGIYRHLEEKNLLNDRQALFGSMGMKHAISIILEKGGVESLSKEQRAYKPDVIDEETGLSYKAIDLDPVKVQSICNEKAQEVLDRISTTGDGQVRLAFVALDGGKVRNYREVFPSPSFMAKLRASIAPVARQVELLAQTLTLGQAVHEEKSTVLVNQKDDPKDANAPRRMASRQVVLGADGSITVSGILLPSRVVVKVQPSVAKSGKPAFPKPAGDLIVRTAGRRHLELNLLPEERRSVFSAYINDNRHVEENPNCPLALVCSTKAVKDDVPNTFFAELQRADTFPQQSLLIADETSIVSHAEGQISKAILIDIAENHLSSIGKEKGSSVSMRVFPDGFSLECGKYKTSHGMPCKVKKTNNGIAARVHVNKSDFISVIKSISTIPLTTPVNFSIDFDKVLKLTFDTWVGAFTVFIPTATTTGVRESRLFRHLDPVPWPEAEVIEPATDTPATETTDE